MQQLDLPLSLVFYKWLLGLESTLTLSDVHHVDPVLAASLHQLHDVVIQKKNLEADPSHVRTLWQIFSIMTQITRCLMPIFCNYLVSTTFDAYALTKVVDSRNLNIIIPIV